MLNELTRGILLYRAFTGDPAEQPRLWLSHGTALAQPLAGDVQYGASSCIPLEPWRLPNPRESEALWTPEPPVDISTCVGLLKIPADVLAPLRATGISEARANSDIAALVQSRKYLAARDRLTEYVSGYRCNEERMDVHPLLVNGAGLLTTTFDHKNNNFLGLHLDSWHGQSYLLRHLSPNRISVNLGLQDRFFLFINLPFEAILASIGPGSEKRHSNQIIQEFLSRNPRYPVVKVRVAPGEAYVAPTENIIHDGSTLGQTAPDVHYTFRGQFGFKRSSVASPARSSLGARLLGLLRPGRGPLTRD